MLSWSTLTAWVWFGCCFDCSILNLKNAVQFPTQRSRFLRLRLHRFRWHFRVIIQPAATPLVLLLSTPAGVYTNMTAFLRVRRSTRRAMLFNVLSTASLAGCEGCYTLRATPRQQPPPCEPWLPVLSFDYRIKPLSHCTGRNFAFFRGIEPLESV